MFSIILWVALAEHSKQLVLNIVPAGVTLVKGMQNHQTVDLILFHVACAINIGCLLHIERELSVLLHHQEFIGCLLKEQRLVRMRLVN